MPAVYGAHTITVAYLLLEDRRALPITLKARPDRRLEQRVFVHSSEERLRIKLHV